MQGSMRSITKFSSSTSTHGLLIVWWWIWGICSWWTRFRASWTIRCRLCVHQQSNQDVFYILKKNLILNGRFPRALSTFLLIKNVLISSVYRFSWNECVPFLSALEAYLTKLYVTFFLTDFQHRLIATFTNSISLNTRMRSITSQWRKVHTHSSIHTITWDTSKLLSPTTPFSIFPLTHNSDPSHQPFSGSVSQTPRIFASFHFSNPVTGYR